MIAILLKNTEVHWITEIFGIGHKWCQNNPDSKVHGANMGPIWDRQDPGGPHVGPMNFAIWELIKSWQYFGPSTVSRITFFFFIFWAAWLLCCPLLLMQFLLGHEKHLTYWWRFALCVSFCHYFFMLIEIYLCCGYGNQLLTIIKKKYEKIWKWRQIYITLYSPKHLNPARSPPKWLVALPHPPQFGLPSIMAQVS